MKIRIPKFFSNKDNSQSNIQQPGQQQQTYVQLPVQQQPIQQPQQQVPQQVPDKFVLMRNDLKEDPILVEQIKQVAFEKKNGFFKAKEGKPSINLEYYGPNEDFVSITDLVALDDNDSQLTQNFFNVILAMEKRGYFILSFITSSTCLMRKR